MRNIILSSVIIIFFYACSTQEIPKSELPGLSSKIVVNAILKSEKKPVLFITNSTDAYEEENPASIENATLKLTYNSIEKTAQFNPFEKHYSFDDPIKSGTSYQLRVEAPRYQSVVSTVTIPSGPLNLKTALVPKGGTDASGFLSNRIDVSFDDPSGANYYTYKLYYYEEATGELLELDYVLSDPSLASSSTIAINGNEYLFSDALFNGQNKTISVVAPLGFANDNSGLKYVVELSEVNSDLYNYYFSLERYKDGDPAGGGGSPIDAPVRIHTNITGGLGILGAYNTQKDSLY